MLKLYTGREQRSVTKVSQCRVTFVTAPNREMIDNGEKSEAMPSPQTNNANPIEDDNEPIQVVFARGENETKQSIFAKLNPRLPLVALAIVALLAAMWGGLLRVGWQFPPIIQILPAVHGPLMIVGFLGTLISLERAVAMQARWAYLAPILSTLGTIILFLNSDSHVGIFIATLGSIALLMIFVVIVNRHLALYTGTMAFGIVIWVLGNLIWLADIPVYRIVNWWAGFLILTIVGERLELSRIQRLSQRTLVLYSIAIGIFLIGLVVDFAEVQFDTATVFGARLVGLGMLAIALWLARFDIARRTVRQQGLTRFIAICLLAGYFWLGVSGALRIYYGGVTGGFAYDAILHTVFLGFVISMIFGHAPIIFPSVLGRPINYRPSFYVHLILLHVSLVLRVIGDLVLTMPWRQWGAMLNVIAVLLFLIATVSSIAQSARATR